MRIITYNVNGVRAAMKKGLLEWMQQAKPDILCLQEIKASPEQVGVIDLEAAGYHHYWYPAQKKGYSGVAIFTKTKPNQVTYGCGIKEYDEEGRVMRADYDDFSVVSVYHPSGTTGELRQNFKMKWLSDFSNYINELVKTTPNLIISGDFNICHTEIDIHNPKGNVRTSGFLPEERKWIDGFMNEGFIDTFRHFNDEPHHYTWWSNFAGARARNLGWRIDYNMASANLRSRLLHAEILSDAMHSDHCPVLLDIKV
jgi:exodeoxyribonuclease III